jgi:hypothetical protein
MANDMTSRAMRDQGAAIPHLSKGEIRDLRLDVDAAFKILEGRPTLTHITGGTTGVSIAGSPVSKPITGLNLLNGKAAATLTFGTGTSQLDFDANRPGTPGNAITVAIVDSGSGGAAYSVSGTDIEIDLGGAAVTADAAKTALDADPEILDLITTTSGGAGNIAVTAQANLAGGTGDGFSVKVNGVEQRLLSPVTDTSIPLSIYDFTGLANLDEAQLLVVSDGLHLLPMQLSIVT